MATRARTPSWGELCKRFRFERYLGAGNFARVMQVRKLGDWDDGTTYAAKVMDKTKYRNLKESDQKKLRRSLQLERRIMASANHFTPELYYAFHSSNRLFFIMDYIPGSDLKVFLSGLQAEPAAITENQITRLCGEMAMGIQILHESDIIHCDLKPENVMLTNSGHVKLIDFGMACERSELRRAGTHKYAAPELFRGSRYYDENVGNSFETDWFAYGAIVGELHMAKCRRWAGQPFHVAIREKSNWDLASHFEFLQEEGECCALCNAVLTVNNGQSVKSVARMLAGLMNGCPQRRWGWTIRESWRPPNHCIPRAHYFADVVDFEALRAGQLGPAILDPTPFAASRELLQNSQDRDAAEQAERDFDDDCAAAAQQQPDSFEGFSYERPQQQQQH